MKKGIFICYRRQDSSALAGRLHDALSNWFPGRVFMDVENIAYGLNFKDQLVGIMNECSIVFALIGPQWATRLMSNDGMRHSEDFVLYELEQAISSRLTVIPILVDGAQMPVPEDLPNSIRNLQLHHALDVRTHCFLRDIAPLRATMCQHLGLRPPTLLEETIEKIPGMVPVTEKLRDFSAKFSACAAMFSALGLLSERAYTEVFVLAFLSCGTGVVGINSKRCRYLAIIGMCMAFVSIGLLLYFVVHKYGHS